MSHEKQNVQSAFHAAIALTTEEKRRDFLNQVFPDDPKQRQRVEALIRAHFGAGGFLGGPDFEDGVAEKPGALIGVYKLLEQIGEGGFGVVFMAEQTRPVRRRVALKVLKPGMDSRQVVARFEAERQALAMMEHPNIAKVFDGGTTPSGRPYFVMELVRGVSITEYCDENQLTTRERLTLFIDVCQAVQHAHQKGIIHRDLKPANVLVTMHDTSPVAKVIDFGVAKAIEHELTDKTLFTRFAQLIGTPLYMSPEQAGQSGLDIDTRSDIYSLGVLLYELLTGTTPFDNRKMHNAAIDELRRIIREEEPQKPSTRIITTGAASSTVAANRKVDPHRLRLMIRGELDWIVMKALEKDRNRRYETANDFAADVRRYLNDEQVQACSPSRAYLLRKYARRHRGPLVTVSLVMIALLAGIVGTTTGWLRASKAQSDAMQQANAKARALADRSNALEDAKDRLFDALLQQARAKRSSGRIGQRFNALQAIHEAASLKNSAELRTEAMAAMVLPDVEVKQEWEAWMDDTRGISFNAALDLYAKLDQSGRLSVCKVQDGKEQVLLQLPTYGKPPFGQVCLSPDGQFVAYGHTGEGNSVPTAVRVWKLDGDRGQVWIDHSQGMCELAMAFDPKSRLLAIGNLRNEIFVYDLPTGKCMHQFQVANVPTHLAFHPYNEQLAVAANRVVQVFDTKTGQQIYELNHPDLESWIHTVAWHPSGNRMAMGCSDRKIHIWDLQTRTEAMPPWSHPSLGATQVNYNRTGDRLITVDWEQRAGLWDAINGRLLLTIPEVATGIFGVNDQTFGFGIEGKDVRLWNISNGRELHVLQRRGHAEGEIMGSPIIHPNGRVLAAYSGSYLVFFDIDTGEQLASTRLPGTPGLHPTFFQWGDNGIPDPYDPWRGAWITADASGFFKWPIRQSPNRPNNLIVGPPERFLPGFASWVLRGATASQNCRVIAVPDGVHTHVVHRDKDGQVVQSLLVGPQFDLRFTAVSPDGKLVVTCSHWDDEKAHNAQIWDAHTGEKIRSLPLKGSTSAHFSPDGKLLFTTSGNGSKIWDTQTWKELFQFSRSGSAFSADGRLLAMATVHTDIRLMDSTSGRDIAALPGPDANGYAPYCFSPDGMRLIGTCAGSNRLYVWDLRSIRQQLKQANLDWDWPEFPIDSNYVQTAPLAITINVGDPHEVVPSKAEKAKREIALCRSRLKANPGNAEDLNELAWLLVASPKELQDPAEALTLAEQAFSKATADSQRRIYRNTLGTVYYRLNRYQETIDLLRPHIAQQDAWVLPFDLYVLAMAHYRLGEVARARDYLEWANRSREHQTDWTEEILEQQQQFADETAQTLAPPESLDAP